LDWKGVMEKKQQQLGDEVAADGWFVIMIIVKGVN
jgi:hypothetical protein